MDLSRMEDCVEASHAKQNFGEVLARASRGPVGVRRHKKLVAALVPADWLSRIGAQDDRRAAREAQRAVEERRLSAHQRIGIDLLCARSAVQRSRIARARREIDRWEAGQLCSRDYIERWRAWLNLPVPALVQRMCSDAQGWGAAMRQNSPFAALGGV